MFTPSRLPIVLVHGFMAGPALMRPMKRRLEREGHRVFLVDLSFWCLDDIEVLAAQLGENLDRIRRECDARLVDVVGVSLGGLLGLYYQQNQAPERRIRRLVTIGTPFRGTWAAAAGIPLLGAISAGIWQTLPTSKVVKRLAERGIPDGTSITSISMRGDLIAPPTRCTFDGAHHVILQGRATPLTHQWLVMSRNTTSTVTRALGQDPT